MRKLFYSLVLFFVSSTTCFAFSDTTDSVYLEAIQSLSEAGILKGYSDGTFRAENSINRAEFMKVVYTAIAGTETSEYCFSDVKDEWFAAPICVAKTKGWVGGYSDGSFKPEQTVNLVEALKIMFSALAVDGIRPQGSEWYSESLETLSALNIVPPSVDYYAEPLTRGEVAEMIWRLLENKQQEASTSLDEFKGSACMDFHAESYDTIDMDRVRETWLGWMNDARADLSLSPYTFNTQLDRTAFVWSDYSKARGVMSHQRPGQTAYYDYYMIQDWFSDLGVSFDNQNGYTFTENIGRGPYSCSADDCTDELLSAIKYSFDYYMNEAGSSYSPHYDSIMSPGYKIIGLGISLSDSQYFLTVHYAAALNSSSTPLCD